MPDPTVVMLNMKATPRDDPDPQQDVIVTYKRLDNGVIGIWQSDYHKDTLGPQLLADLEADIGETFA